MDGDLELAAGCGLHVVRERNEIFRMRIVGRIGGRQIPFGLGGRRSGGQCDRGCGERK